MGAVIAIGAHASTIIIIITTTIPCCTVPAPATTPSCTGLCMDRDQVTTRLFVIPYMVPDRATIQSFVPSMAATAAEATDKSKVPPG